MKKLRLLFYSILCVFGLTATGAAWACTSSQIDTGSGCENTKFTVTTTSVAADGTFQFKISAKGTFYVDCGEGGTLSGTGVSGNTITRTDTTQTTYTCTYSTAGIKTVKFGGVATEYATGNTAASAAIQFSANTAVESTVVKAIEGSIGSVFPTLGSGSSQIPIFYEMCQRCVELTTITADLFSGVTGAKDGMFRGIFDKCKKLTGIPQGLFSGVSGSAPNMFRSAFMECKALTQLPADLFAGIDGAAEDMFRYTFNNCTNLKSYIPATLFAGAHGGTATNFMYNIFNNSGLKTSCPSGMTQYITGYESAWASKVACVEGHTITYSCGDGDGTIPASGTATYGSAFTPATNTCTAPAGYEFDKWLVSGTETTVVAGTEIAKWDFDENETLVAQYTPLTYTVSYSCGAGNDSLLADADIVYGESFTPATNTCAVPNGYRFDGWSVSGTEDIKASGTEFTWNYVGDKTFTAHFVPQDYTITYACGDGTGDAPATNTSATFGASFTPATNTCAVPSGYEFLGWLISGTETVVSAGTAFTWEYAGNKTLTAQYKLYGYTVTYACGNGTGDAPATVHNIESGNSVTPAANTCTAPSGYRFDGWSVSGTETTVSAGSAFNWAYDEDKTFTAHFAPQDYTITYSCGDGTGDAPTVNTTATYNASFTPAANTCTVPAGYNAFSGWLISDTETVVPAGTGFTWGYTENKILTAQYTPNSYECNEGEYLPANATVCVACSTGMHCSGGEFDFNPSVAQGIGTCAVGYYKDSATTCAACGINSSTTDENEAATCTCNTGYTTINGDSTSTSGCSILICASGTYLPANEITCTACPTGYYCAGGNVDVVNNSTDQGLTTNCATGYYKSGGLCVACGANSTTVDNNESTTCTCNNGYTSDGTSNGALTSTTGCIMRAFDLTTLDYTENGTIGYAKSSMCSTCSPSGTECSYNAECQSDLETNGWKVVFGNGNAIYGTAKCSTTQGATNHIGNPGNTQGVYCWCEATGYKPNGQALVSVTDSVWVSHNGSGSGSLSNCTTYCASACALDTVKSSDFRAPLYGYIVCDQGTYLPGNTDTCTTCPTGYYCNGGAFLESANDQGLSSNCAAGYYKSGNSCVACGANSSTVDNNESSTCACDTGYTTSNGESTSTTGCSMLTCAAGTYLPANATTCASCPVGYYCTGGTVDVVNNSSDQGLTGSCANIAIGWTSAAGQSAMTGCYYPITLNKNGFSGTINAGAGTGCRVAETATGTDSAILNIFYNTACTLPSVELTQTGFTTTTSWAEATNIGLDSITMLDAMTTTPDIKIYYANKTGCATGYYKSGHNCLACGTHSSTANNNTVTTCTCETGYTVDGTTDGLTTGTNGCQSTLKFDVTTTNLSAGAQVKFSISATGTFGVYCGEGGTLSGDGVSGNIITRSSTSSSLYTCTYTTGGVKHIGFAGTATGYSTSNTTAAISFNADTNGTPTLIASLGDGLGEVFPTLGNSNGQKPIFYEMCKGCSNLTSIDEDLFDGVTGAADGMFRSAFEGCTNLTTIPEDLFASISGSAPNMFRSTFSGCSSVTDLPEDLFESIDGAEEGMFMETFKNTTGLSGKYVPPLLFYGAHKETAVNFMTNIFNGSGLLTVCPAGKGQIETGYEMFWSNKVACGNAEDVTCEGATYRDGTDCIACPAGYTYNTTLGKTSINQCQMYCPAGTWTGMYTQVEYLQASGSQYIDTGYLLSASNIEVELVVSLAKDASTFSDQDAGNFLGNIDSANGFSGNYKKGQFGLWVAKGTGGSKTTIDYSGYKKDTLTSLTYQLRGNQRYLTAVVGNSDLGTSNVNNTFDGSVISQNTLKIFTNGCPGGCGDKKFQGRVHSFKMRSVNLETGTKTLMYDMIPVRRYDGVLGMFDKVTGGFFANSGTGSFAAGPDTQNVFGGSSCIKVGYGYYADESLTNAGSYSTRISCEEIMTTPGQYSTNISECEDAGDTTACVEGTYMPANTTDCEPCPAGSFCEGGHFNNNYGSDQGIKSCVTELGEGWDSDAGAEADTDCYYLVTLHKNGYTGNLSAGAGTGCSVAATANSSDNAQLKVFYNTECTLPTMTLVRPGSGFADAHIWTLANTIGATEVTTIPASTEISATKTFYARRSCSAGYYASSSTGCTVCGENSSSVDGNITNTCICDDGYVSSNGGSTSTSGCVATAAVCETGEYLPGGSSECVTCPTGFYCPGGTFPPSENDQGLTTNCAAGYYKSGNSCLACGENSTTADNNTVPTCACNDGYLSPTGTETSTSGCLEILGNCAAGEYLPGGETSCEPCPVGNYCAGGIYTESEDDQGAEPCPEGWTSATGQSTIDGCYYEITLNKNGFSGVIEADSGTGCKVAETATGKTNAILKLFYDTACTLPIIEEMVRTGYADSTGWAEADTIGANAVTTIAATTTTPSVTTYYVNKTSCDENYYMANATTCSSCGIHSSTPDENTLATCTCDTGYSADGTVNGATTSINGCVLKAVTCVAGTYLPANSTQCAICPADNYCLGGSYTLSATANGALPCPNSLFAPTGMSASNQCGRKMHIGENILYLHQTKKTTPSLNVDINNDGTPDYYANMSLDPMTITANSERLLQVQYGNNTYYVYDDSGETTVGKIDTGTILVDTKFSLTTTNLSTNDTFTFTMAAGGTFYVDCGTDGTLSGTGVDGVTITRNATMTNINNQFGDTYTCTYTTGGVKTIKMAGTATGYGNDYLFNSTLRFYNSGSKVAAIDGDLSAMFPVLGPELTQQPRLRGTFAACTGLTSLPPTLFASYTTGANSMFSFIFSGCTGLTTIPGNLFATITTGAERMFEAAFYNCTGLTSIPGNLFASITTAESRMFVRVFDGCTGLSGYIPSSMFAGLIANESPYESYMMDRIFYNTGLDESCPTGTTQYTTGYEEYWDGKVSCIPNGN